MQYVLFLLTNAALFLRPGEVISDLEGVQVYQALIVATLAFSLRHVVAGLSPPALFRQPITLCILGVWGTAILSQLVQGQFGEAFWVGLSFGKIVLYYLLLIGLVNTPKKLSHFLSWLAVFTTGAVGLAVLHYHDYIVLPGFQVYRELWTDPQTGEQTSIGRPGGAGIFNDPNDLCLICTLGTLVCVSTLCERRFEPLRFFWIFPIALFLYAIKLSQSRGGFLGLLAGLTVLIRARYGWRGLLMGAMLFTPVLAFMINDRLTNFNLDEKENTGQERIQLWCEGFSLFRDSPILGIGAGRYEDEVGLVAHNSFVHAFVELGILGGTCFIGAFYLAIWPLARLSTRMTQLANVQMFDLQPLVLSIVVAYSVGNLSLSRNYIVPTYLVLGLSAAYLKMAGPAGRPQTIRTLAGITAHLAAIGTAAVVAIYLAIRLLARFG